MLTELKNVLGVVVGRGGSKGVPRKNVRLVGGRPLVEWAVRAGAGAKRIDHLILSTNDEEIQAVCRALPIDIPFTRPAELASDTARPVDVLAHALAFFAERGQEFRYVALLQPTSPLVTAEQVDRVIALALETSADTVISVYAADHVHPRVMYRMGDDGRAAPFLENVDVMARRQDLDPVFVRTGLCYVVKTSVIRDDRTIYGRDARAVVVPPEMAVCIDSELDLEIASFLLERRNRES